MENLFENLKLISKFITQNYSIEKIDNEIILKDIIYNKPTSIKEIYSDIELYYPFGEQHIDIIISEWIKPIGMTKETLFEWDYHYSRNLSYVRKQLQFDDNEDLNNYNIENPITISTVYSYERIRYHSTQESELTLIREICRNIAIELSGFYDVRDFDRCNDFRTLEYLMRRLGFEMVRIYDTSQYYNNIRWIETDEAWRERRNKYYYETRTKREVDLKIEQIKIQRELLDRTNYEAEYRLRNESIGTKRRSNTNYKWLNNETINYYKNEGENLF